MHTYHIFYAITSCDKDWQLLESIQALDKVDAVEQAVQRWGKEYASSELIVLSDGEMKTGVIVGCQA